MSGHLSLKWNNHSVAFLKKINSIQTSEKYCDATIACQGKYFPVHRVILSTCSDYFDEIFERIQCPHPYVVFKDIEPHEMELLLNYMYQGEVNVVQEMLPSLIKAAEALRIKGLAVPDDIPSDKEHSSSRKRSSTHDTPLSKRRSEEGAKRRRGDYVNFSAESQRENNPGTSECTSNNSPEKSTEHNESLPLENDTSQKNIKEEPVESGDFDSSSLSGNYKNENFNEFPSSDGPPLFVKTEPPSSQSYGDQGSWDFGGESNMAELPMEETSGRDDMPQSPRRQEIWPEGMRGDMVGMSFAMDNTSTALRPQHRGHGPRIRPCPHCKYKTPRSDLLKKHIQLIHLKPEERPFRCHLCPSQFKQKPHLQTHMRTHTNERPFPCSHCSLRFKHKSGLKYHLETRHGNRPVVENRPSGL